MKQFKRDLTATMRWVIASMVLGVVLYALLGIFFFGVVVAILATPIVLVFKILSISWKRHDR